MKIAWDIVIVVLVVGAVYILSAIPQAYAEFKTRPREPMQWCHQHGYFRKKHVLPFMGTTVCPRCYMEAWNKAEAGKLGPQATNGRARV